MNERQNNKPIINTNIIYLHAIFNMKHEILPAGIICVHAGMFYTQTGTICTVHSTDGHKSFIPIATHF